MKKITKDVLKDCANRLYFDMSDSEYDSLLKEFEVIVKQMELIDKVNGVSEYSPITFPFVNETTYLREDISETPLSQEEALKNAKSKLDGKIKLPKVVN